MALAAARRSPLVRPPRRALFARKWEFGLTTRLECYTVASNCVMKRCFMRIHGAPPGGPKEKRVVSRRQATPSSICHQSSTHETR